MIEGNDDNDESGKLPTWIEKSRLFEDVAAVVYKYDLTLGQFYDALGVDVYKGDSDFGSARTKAINEIADHVATWKRKQRGC